MLKWFPKHEFTLCQVKTTLYHTTSLGRKQLNFQIGRSQKSKHCIRQFEYCIYQETRPTGIMEFKDTRNQTLDFLTGKNKV